MVGAPSGPFAPCEVTVPSVLTPAHDVVPERNLTIEVGSHARRETRFPSFDWASGEHTYQCRDKVHYADWIRGENNENYPFLNGGHAGPGCFAGTMDLIPGSSAMAVTDRVNQVVALVRFR